MRFSKREEQERLDKKREADAERKRIQRLNEKLSGREELRDVYVDTNKLDKSFAKQAVKELIHKLETGKE